MKDKVTEKELNPVKGGLMLVGMIVGIIACIALAVIIPIAVGNEESNLNALIMIPLFGIIVFIFLAAGFKVVNPNEAYVLNFFGKYYGTLKKEGFYWVNPFTTTINPAGNIAGIGLRKVSLNAMTLNN